MASKYKTYKSVLEANEKDLDRYATYQEQRCRAFQKQTPAPIYKDDEGKLHWLNRAARRKAKIK